jgi:hypothetical protein
MTIIVGLGSGSGSISKRHGYADPDPHQNVMDPQHCLLPRCVDGSGGVHPEPDLEGRGGNAGATGQAQGDWVRWTNFAMPFIYVPDQHPCVFLASQICIRIL